jgi:hypothetical protein
MGPPGVSKTPIQGTHPAYWHSTTVGAISVPVDIALPFRTRSMLFHHHRRIADAPFLAFAGTEQKRESDARRVALLIGTLAARREIEWCTTHANPGLPAVRSLHHRDRSV